VKLWEDVWVARGVAEELRVSEEVAVVVRVVESENDAELDDVRVVDAVVDAE